MAAPLPRSRFGTQGLPVWRRWFVTVTVGEVAGFSVPAVTGALVFRAGAAVEFLVLVMAGAVEGVILGFAQASALHGVIPEISGRRWIRVTATGAAVAWAIGMVPATLGDRLTRVPPALLVTVGLALALVLLSSLGFFQWRVLRGHVPGSARWIPATAAAWLAGLGAFTAVTSPLWHEGQPIGLIAAIGILGGVTMAAVMAALSGLALVWLLRTA